MKCFIVENSESVKLKQDIALRIPKLNLLATELISGYFAAKFTGTNKRITIASNALA